jgi:hypothetical protein
MKPGAVCGSALAPTHHPTLLDFANGGGTDFDVSRGRATVGRRQPESPLKGGKDDQQTDPRRAHAPGRGRISALAYGGSGDGEPRSVTRTVDGRRLDLLPRSRSAKDGVQRSGSRPTGTRGSRRSSYVQLQVVHARRLVHWDEPPHTCRPVQRAAVPSGGRVVLLHPAHRLLQVRALLEAQRS